MRQSTLRLLLVLAGTLLFNFCFWQEKMGLNVLLFTLFYLPALWYLFPESRGSRGFLVTAGGTLLTALLIVWHNSSAAKFTWIISAMCAAGYAQERTLRYILYAWGQYLWGWWQAPGHLLDALNAGNGTGAKRGRSLRRQLALAFTPLAIASIFYFLYYLANDKFAALSDGFWRQVGQLLSFDFSIVHTCFVTFGFFLVGAAFWRNKTELAAADQAQADALRRVRPPRGRLVEEPSPLGLRQEYRQSLLLLWMLNLLLFLVNATDLRYVWFGFDDAAQQNLKSYVHEGTYFLIASILLAMSVLLHVFRRNLNFYPRRQALLRAAIFWLAQNALLVLSVGVRNWRYIDFHGLAYKRIGVVLFLLLVLFGLTTLWLKIRDRRTMSWLWRQNGWAFYVLLLLNAGVNWDVFITRYNLSGQPKGAIDVKYLLYTVSDKNLFLLEEQAAVLPEKNMYPLVDPSAIRSSLESKRLHFEAMTRRYSWKSWNAADARNGR